MKLVLTLESGAAAGQEYALERGALALGRGEGCDVRFDSAEGSVSRRHALIEALEDGFRLTDQNSSNGTHVNQQRAATALLQTGDLIELGSGGPRLRVRIEEERAPAGPDAAESGAGGATRGTPRPSLANVSLYDPTRDKGRGYSVLSIAVVLGMTFLGLGLGLLVLLLSVFELGPGAAVVGVFVAFLPAPFYLAIWLWLDRYDPEPAWILAGCLAWGAGAATFVASIVNSVFGAVVLSLTQSKEASEFLSASISAPFVEEATKGLAVLLVFLFLRREFDGVLDGIVYAGVVALGFATVENVLYYGRIVEKQGAPGLIVLFVLRGVLGPFGHSIYTSMTGIGCGIARQTHNKLLRWLAPPLGYLGAVLLHFLWNTMAGLSESLLSFLVLYAVVWAPLFLLFFAVVIWMGHRESRLIRRLLEHEVAAGLITREQADLVGSWPRRMAWLASTLGDMARLGARRRFLYAATRLALCYWHIERAAAAGGMTLSLGQVPAFRRELARLKGSV